MPNKELEALEKELIESFDTSTDDQETEEPVQEEASQEEETVSEDTAEPEKDEATKALEELVGSEPKDDPEPDTKHEEAHEAEVKDEEPLPFDDRVEVFEKELGLTEEAPEHAEPDEKAFIEAETTRRVSEYQTQLNQIKQQLENRNETYFGKVPQGGVYQQDGRSIYEMTEAEVNDYVTELSDAGKTLDAQRVVTGYNQYMQAANLYLQHEQMYNQAVNQLPEKQQEFQKQAEQSVRNNTEWAAVRDTFMKKFPELTQSDIQRAHALLQQQELQTDFIEKTATLEGKTRLAYQAIKKLGILDKYKPAKPEPEPSASPDAQASSKKVKITPKSGPATSAKKVAQLSQKEFNKLSKEEITKALHLAGE